LGAFFPDWPWAMILCISASQVFRIIGMGHWDCRDFLKFCFWYSSSKDWLESLHFLPH
jgi:hypothetical protein